MSDVAAGLMQGSMNQVPLELRSGLLHTFFETSVYTFSSLNPIIGQRASHGRRRQAARLPCELRQVRYAETTLITEQHGVLDDVLEFAQVAGPGIARQNIEHLVIDSVDGLAQALGVARNEMSTQRRNIF